MSSTAPLPTEAPLELTIIMPCLNEAETLATCIDKANAALRDNGIAGEVVVADNGSTEARNRSRATTARGSSPCQSAATALHSTRRPRREKPVCAHGRRGRQLRLRTRSRASSPSSATAPNSSWAIAFRGGIGPGAMPPLHQISRQSRAQLPRPLALPHAYRRLPLRYPRLLRRCLQAPRPPDDRHGVCQRDGRQVRAARSARSPRSRPHSRRTAAAARRTSARGATAGVTALPADVFAALALPHPRPRAHGPRPRAHGVAPARQSAPSATSISASTPSPTPPPRSCSASSSSFSASPPRSSPPQKGCCPEIPASIAGSATSRSRPASSPGRCCSSSASA